MLRSNHAGNHAGTAADQCHWLLCVDSTNEPKALTDSGHCNMRDARAHPNTVVQCTRAKIVRLEQLLAGRGGLPTATGLRTATGHCTATTAAPVDANVVEANLDVAADPGLQLPQQLVHALWRGAVEVAHRDRVLHPAVVGGALRCARGEVDLNAAQRTSIGSSNITISLYITINIYY